MTHPPPDSNKKCPKINGEISELRKRLRDEEAIKTRNLLTLAGKMTQFEAFEFVKQRIEKQLGNNSNPNGSKK